MNYLKKLFQLVALVAIAGIFSISGQAAAQIYVSNVGDDTIGKYNLDGTPTGSGTLVSGISFPGALTVSGSDLYVMTLSGSLFEYTSTGTMVGSGPLISGLNFDSLGLSITGTNIFISNVDDGTVGLYNTLGNTVNATLIQGLNQPTNILTTATNLFVAEGGAGNIDEFDFSGNLVGGAPLITGLDNPTAIALYNSELYIADYASGKILQYNLDGTPVGSGTLISGLSNPSALSISGSIIYVMSKDDSVINTYDLSGNPLSIPLVTGLNIPYGLAVVPEPSTWALLGLGLGLLFYLHGRRSKSPVDGK